MKKILPFAIFGILIVLAILLFNIFRKTSPEKNYSAIHVPKLTDSAIRHLTSAIGYKTISYSDASKFDFLLFIGFLIFLANTYPGMHTTLRPAISDCIIYS